MSNGIASLASLQNAEPAVPAVVSGGVKASGTSFAPAEPVVTPATLYPNPSFHIDPALGLVVMEFRNEAGAVSSSIPTVQQLDAYRRAAGNAAASPAARVAAPAGTGTGIAGAAGAATGTPAVESTASAQSASLPSSAVTTQATE